jgi:hypothetical protein
MKQLQSNIHRILINTKLFMASNIKAIFHNLLQGLKDSVQTHGVRSTKLQFIHSFPRPRVPASPRRRFQSGQSVAEFVILVPLFVLMAGVMVSVAYICFQGIKVQQAANLAARIQGQERILGGSSPDSLELDDRNLYNNITKAVKRFFNKGEEAKLTIYRPDIGINSDRVTIERVLNPPNILGLKLPEVKLEATAYGGEDTHMHSMPRWGGGFYKGALERTSPKIQD